MTTAMKKGLVRNVTLWRLLAVAFSLVLCNVNVVQAAHGFRHSLKQAAAALNPTHIGRIASVNATLLLVTLESDQRHSPGDIDSFIRRYRVERMFTNDEQQKY
ncbi:hypothetical protein CAJAP_00667 [Camponotus japonicus]